MMITDVVSKCPVCRTQFEVAQNNVFYITDRMMVSNIARPTLISFCPQCEVGMAFPQLADDQIDGLYTDGDYWKESSVKVFSPQNNPGQYVMAESRWRFVEEYIKDQKKSSLEEISILDIGGGHGFFGMAVNQSQRVKLKEVFIIEKDKFFIQSSRLTWGERFPKVDFHIEDSLENIPKGKTFNLVILSHILEHLNDPKQMILSAAEKMLPGGLMFIDLPYRDYLFKKDIFPHVLFFNEKSVKKLIESAGLEVETVRYFGWNRKISPLNYRHKGNFSSYVEKLLYKLRSFVPISILKMFFDWYLGASREDPDGTWIRALARKCSPNA